MQQHSSLVPEELLQLTELNVKGQDLQNGCVRLRFDQFAAGVRTLVGPASR